MAWLANIGCAAKATPVGALKNQGLYFLFEGSSLAPSFKHIIFFSTPVVSGFVEPVCQSHLFFLSSSIPLRLFSPLSELEVKELMQGRSSDEGSSWSRKLIGRVVVWGGVASGERSSWEGAAGEGSMC